MIGFVRYLTLFFILKSTSGDTECENLGIRLYEELGCIPIKEKETDKCPTHYNCGSFERLSDGCYFEGKKYSIGDNIPTKGCKADCTCRKSGNDDKPKFLCAQIECPEHFGLITHPGCWRTYELGKCCSTEEICSHPNNVTQCQYNSKTYYEGEKIYMESCDECICKDGFSGNIETPFCQKIYCGNELEYADKLEQNCAPIYYSFCCPFTWVCHTGEEKTITPSSTSQVSTDKVCKFGPKELKVGERFITKQEPYTEDVECECKVPPLAMCTFKK